MKEHLIKKYFNTKRKANAVFTALGIKPPKTGGIEQRQKLLMQVPFSKLKALAHV